MLFAPALLPLVLAQGQVQNEITVYNQGFALVKETRTLSLRQGRQQVALEDVAALIEPASVGIRSLTDPASIEVWEQNYQYDLISPQAILNKAVGQRIRFLRVLPNGVKEVLEGVLLSAPNAIVNNPDGGAYQTYNGMVIRTDDGRIVLNPAGEIEVSSIPDGLISKPTLLWDLMSAKAGENTVEVSYTTRGMSWTADYVLMLDGATQNAKADIKGWVTLTNNSGKAFKETRLKLLAGDVQRLMGGGGGFGGGRAAKAMDALEQNRFQQESLFEYYLYTLQRPATIRDKEMKQLSLMEGKGIQTTKKLILDSMMGMGVYYPGEGEIGTGPMKPQVRIIFKNSKENELGIPLPAGRVKVYQRDKSGSVQMLGEDAIGHTPKDETISLVVGRSFDIVGERKRTNFQRIGDRVVRETFEIEVRNRKDAPETVNVVERHYGDWRVISKTMDFTKLDANTMEFVVTLKAGEVRKITYTVETRW